MQDCRVTAYLRDSRCPIGGTQKSHFSNLRDISHSGFVVSWTLIVFFVPSPHPFSLQLGPLLGFPILVLERPKFGSSLRFVYGRQPHSEHLQAHISSYKPPPHIDCCNRSIILILLIDVSPDSSVQGVVGEPIQGILRIWLAWSSKVGQFWGIYTSQSNMDLPRMPNQQLSFSLS